jgi:hypothetical protein
MLMRQQPISDEDAPQGDILELARKAQETNGKPDRPGSDEEVRGLLKRLYVACVPSALKESQPNCQRIAREYIHHLCNPESTMGMGKSKGGAKPRSYFMADGAEKDEQIRKEGARKAERIRTASYVRLRALGILPLFPIATRVSERGSRREWRGEGSRKSKPGRVRTFDYDMLQQALERLNSWESWNHRVKKRRAELAEKQTNLRKQCDLDSPCHQRLIQYERSRTVRLNETALESERGYTIRSRSLRGWTELHERWLKISKADRSEAALRKIVAEMQTRLRGKFGDASDLYPWLAKPENHLAWDERAEKNALPIHARYNEAVAELEAAKEEANYTPPDALLHPLWARSGHSGDQNIHSYHITETDGNLSVEMRLLFEDPEGRVTERDEKIPLRPSGQWNRAQRGDTPPLRLVRFEDVPKEFHTGAKNDAKCTWVAFTDPGTGGLVHGSLGGARLQLERSDFRLGAVPARGKTKREMEFAEGNIGRAYLNLTVSLPNPPKNSAHLALVRPKPKSDTALAVSVDYYLRGSGKEDKRKKPFFLTDVVCGAGKMTDGLRIMAVDLGLRQLAACAVFELTREAPKVKLAFAVADADGLWMVQNRKFLIHLSGEAEDGDAASRRDKIREERFDLRAAVRRLSRLLSIGRLDEPEEKAEELGGMVGSSDWENSERRKKVDGILDPKLLESLKPFAEKPNDPRWPEAVKAVHRQWEASLGKAIAEWRRRGRMRGKQATERGYGGLSLWHVEELQETRRLLNSWSCHSRDYETMKDGSRRPAIVRAKKRWGLAPGEEPVGADLDERLLHHINNLKEDRQNVGADKIVMAALGFEYEGKAKGWVQHHPPCQFILFEDLSRYRFKTDRPRRENSMLMKWAHREIPRTVAMQGEVHGLVVGTVAAEFSSKFRAGAQALTPGVRCHEVTARDLQPGWFRSVMETDIAQKRRKELPGVGQLVPIDGGEWFCTLNADGSLYKTHADLNAAQNLARRFWTRYRDLYRLSCRKADLKGQEVWVPKTIGKRVGAALKQLIKAEACKLIPIDGDPEEGCRMESATLREIGAKKTGDEAPDQEGLADEMEEVAELRGEGMTFFRDPSGIICPADLWFPAKVFWGRVRSRVGAVLAGDDLKY